MRVQLAAFVVVAMAFSAGCSCGNKDGHDGGMGGGAGGGGGGVGGGGGGSDAGTDGGTDAGAPYDEFDAWREMLGVIRQSPDAVPARADALVAAKDAQGLFALVRDDVAMLPTTNSLYGAGTYVRWGPRATLRGAAGTPRERADLLAWLYTRAGFTATVMVGTPRAGVTVTAQLAHGGQRQISYQPSDELFAKWDAALLPDPSRADAGFADLDADGGLRNAILAQIEPLLPAAPTPTPFDPTLGEVPLVQVMINGAAQYANPNVDGAVFGDAYSDDPMPAAPASGERSLHVTLEAERSTHPGERITLIDNTWSASQVAGRNITASFVTPNDFAGSTVVKVGEATTFIPVLMVRGDGLDTDAGYALSVVGNPVLKDGSQVAIGADGGLVIEGEPIATGPTPAATLTSVAQLTAKVNASAFPDIELSVSAMDAQAHNVSGLAADAFVVKEDGANMVASLRRTSAGVPQVVLLFDQSGSIPMEFLTGAPALGHAVAQQLFTQFPGSQVQVAEISITGAIVEGPMVSTLADVDAQLALLAPGGSAMWEALDSFSLTRATAIVCITDAVADNAPTADALARLNAGPPVLLAGVGAVDTVTANQVASVSGGQYLASPTTSSLPGQVAAFVAERAAYDYKIVYRAQSMGASTRQVTVSLAAPGTATVTTPYDPPAMPVAAGALSALYLTIETDGHSVTRTLATGADVEGALFGRYVLAVEANPPSLSTLLDEEVTERLQLEEVTDAYLSNDAMAIARAAKNRFTHMPGNLRFSQAMLPGDEVPTDVTFVDGLSVTLSSTLPRLGVKTVYRYDLLPLVPRQTISFNGGEVYRTTLERTALRDAFEAANYPRNTLAALAGKTLQRFDSLSVEALGPQWAGAAYPTYNDYDIYAPADGSVVAFWAVHKVTGDVIGVMPEGGLGEGESTEALVDRLVALCDAASRAGTATGYNGISVWADLEKTKVILLGGVIELLEGEGSNPWGNAAGNACGAALDGIGGQIPGYQQFNMVGNDLESIARLLHLAGYHDVPITFTPTGGLCAGIFGH